MENQSTTNPSEATSINSVPIVQPSTPIQTKTSLVVPILLTLLVCAVVFGFGGYYFGKMSSEPQKINSDSLVVTQSPTPSTIVVTPTSNPVVSQSTDYFGWSSYTNQGALYEIKYPSGWRVVPYNTGEGYGPKEIGEDVLWAINFYEKSKYTLDQVAAEFGKQFSDRKQTKQNVTINGLSAAKYITTTPSAPDWYYETLVIERGSSYIVISNGAINSESLQKMKGVPAGTTFEKFYQSFLFVN